MSASPQPPSPKNQIVLVGSMGAGKSAIGKALASGENCGFIDIDHAISQQAGCSIPQYFQTYGEAQFRDLERSIVKQVVSSALGERIKWRVVAIGGGGWQSAETRELVAQFAVSVWLDVEHEVLWERVNRHLDRRPMLHCDDPKARLLNLLKQRVPAFCEADVRVALSEQTIEEAARKVREAVKHHLNAPRAD